MARSQPRPVIIDRVLLTIVLGGVLPVGWGGANSDMSNPGLAALAGERAKGEARKGKRQEDESEQGGSETEKRRRS